MSITSIPCAPSRRTPVPQRPAWLPEDGIPVDLAERIHQHADAARDLVRPVRAWVET